MLQQVTVNFNFDPEEGTVSDLTCFVDGVERKKKATRSTTKKESEPVKLEDEAIMKVEDAKLVFNNKIVADMGLVYQDRLVIKYKQLDGQKKPMPLIAKDVDWAEEGTGNKLTKTNTLSYRGKANTILSEYGTEFTIEPYKEGIWKLISKNEGVVKATAPVTRKEVEAKADDLDVSINVDDDNTDEIEEIAFTL